MPSIIISPCGSEYAIYVTVGKHSRTYASPSLEAAQVRARRLCFMLDLREDIITHGNRPVDTNISKPVHKPARQKK